MSKLVLLGMLDMGVMRVTRDCHLKDVKIIEPLHRLCECAHTIPQYTSGNRALIARVNCPGATSADREVRSW